MNYLRDNTKINHNMILQCIMKSERLIDWKNLKGGEKGRRADSIFGLSDFWKMACRPFHFVVILWTLMVNILRIIFCKVLFRLLTNDLLQFFGIFWTLVNILQIILFHIFLHGIILCYIFLHEIILYYIFLHEIMFKYIYLHEIMFQ